MEVRARLESIAPTEQGSVNVTFSCPSGDYEKLADKDIRLKAVIWREKRSLSANAYFYVLITKLAEKLSESITEVHNQAIADYGYPDEQVQTIILRDDIDWRKLDMIHLRPTTDYGTMGDGQVWRKYIVMRGSHTYDSKEMSRLIDGLVDECREQGIETLPPEELARMYVEAENA